ncbi:MAG: hypothetical protein ACOCZS_01750 [Verrucomicrobiota bacterium]
MMNLLKKKMTAIVLTVGFLAAAVAVVPGCDQQPGEGPGMGGGEEGGGEQPAQPMQPDEGGNGGDGGNGEDGE